MKGNVCDRAICPEENGILQALIEVQSGRFVNYTPHDKPYLLAMLANHRRACQTCQGVPLAEQLFGKAVEVGGMP